MVEVGRRREGEKRRGQEGGKLEELGKRWGGGIAEGTGMGES